MAEYARSYLKILPYSPNYLVGTNISNVSSKQLNLLNTQNSKIMALIRYNPNKFRPIAFSRLLDNFFDDRFQGGTRQVDFTPSVDISETDKAFEIHLAIPGVKKSDVNIAVENDHLTISGERNYENETNDKNFHSRESFFGKFSRSFTLPEMVNVDKIDAKQEDGILKITLPKDEKKVAKKLIKVG